MQNQNEEQYDEIDLMDYILVILRRKWLISAIFILAVLGAGLFSFLSPKIYQIDTSLEIGVIDEKSIEKPEQLKEKIEGGVYDVLVKETLNIAQEKYPKIKAETLKETNLVKIKIESSDTGLAKNVLEELDKIILKRHEDRIKNQKEILENNIETIENKIQFIDNDIEKIGNKIKITESDIEKTRNKTKPLENDIERIENEIEYAKEEKENLEAKVESLEQVLVYEQTPGTQFALFDAKEKLAGKKREIESLYSRINSLNIQIENLNLEINSLRKTKEDYGSQVNPFEKTKEDYNAQINSLKLSLDDIKPTKTVKPATISPFPIKPNMKLNIAIAGVLGLFVGIFLAFGKEWWQKNKGKI